MTLHTLNKQRQDLMQLCISVLAPGDSLLLLEDGVYAALAKAPDEVALANTLPAGIKLYALTEDVAARGLTGNFPDAVTRITYRDFVSLSLTCNKVVNWN